MLGILVHLKLVVEIVTTRASAGKGQLFTKACNVRHLLKCMREKAHNDLSSAQERSSSFWFKNKLNLLKFLLRKATSTGPAAENTRLRKNVKPGAAGGSVLSVVLALTHECLISLRDCRWELVFNWLSSELLWAFTVRYQPGVCSLMSSSVK